MARRGSSAVAEEENPTQDVTEEVTESQEADVTEASEAPEEQPAEPDLSAFEAAVAEAVEAADSATGDVPEAFIGSVQKAYRELEGGVKTKNRAKAFLQDGVRQGMAERSMPKARANMILLDSLATAAKAGGARAEREPADPTEAFVARVAALALADHLLKSNVPEGVSEDWSTKANDLVSQSTDATDAYYNWTVSTAEDKGEAPEVASVVRAAVKIAQGRSSRGLGSGRSTGPRAAYTGPKRDVAKHIYEAFADKNSGDFMTIAELRAFKSEEYGPDDAPSPGALTARLFPPSGGPCTLEGVLPSTNEQGKRGAVKA